MKITREAAVALFAALGITSAGKWNAKRMAAKLTKVDEMVDEDTNLEGDADETLTAVLGAIENGEDIEVLAAAKKAPEEKPAAEAKKAAPKKDAAKKDAPKAEKKAAKPKAEKKPGIPGVRETRTRPFLAGVVIAKHGHSAGVTEEMVNELDELYGKVNPAESIFTLRNAWHAIRGFQKGEDN